MPTPITRLCLEFLDSALGSEVFFLLSHSLSHRTSADTDETLVYLQDLLVVVVALEALVV